MWKVDKNAAMLETSLIISSWEMESSRIKSLLWQHCCKNIKVYNEASTLQKKASVKERANQYNCSVKKLLDKTNWQS